MIEFQHKLPTRYADGKPCGTYNSPARKITAHILLPEGKRCEKLLIDGREADFSIKKVGDSLYVNTEVRKGGDVCFEILFA